MTKFEKFLQQLKERIDDDGYIKDDFILRINGHIVNYCYTGTDKEGDPLYS